jgi:uncharacterized protein (UPF0332 family)
MTLQKWVEFGWLRQHQSSRKEVEGLLSIVDRDLESARVEQLSPDWRFGIAYNAALKLCTILLHGSGYRPEKAQAHYRTIQALPMILGDSRKDDASYLDTCRIKRNKVEYETAGSATETDAEELVRFGLELRDDVLSWLKKNHPEFL